MVLEALSSGLPVVASSVGGVPETVIQGVNGFLFPPGDWKALAQYLRFLLEDEGLGHKMGSASRKIATSFFSLEKMLGEYRRLYEALAT